MATLWNRFNWNNFESTERTWKRKQLRIEIELLTKTNWSTNVQYTLLNGNVVRYDMNKRCYSPWAIVQFYANAGQWDHLSIYFVLLLLFTACDNNNNLMFKFKCSKWILFQIPKINTPKLLYAIYGRAPNVCVRIDCCVFGSLFDLKSNLHTHFCLNEKFFA